MILNGKYDVIVVGAGHAGAEAACAAAKMSCKVLLITPDLTKIAFMSCNPAVGGIAKGQIVREIGALGGQMADITDKTMIQFRMLNKSKGPAMWSPRAQCDRRLFTYEWRKRVEEFTEIDLIQDAVTSIIIENEKCKGVNTRSGLKFKSECTVLTTGTFLNGIIHIGNKKIEGGRISENSSKGITETLQKYGFKTSRLKTGTSPRVDERTIDYTKLKIQEGDEEPGKFSFDNENCKIEQQVPCYITHTNENVHNILKKGFSQSPLFTGRIKGRGPRYCPSIEDKLVTFPEKDRHQLFVEPEGKETYEVYINGYTTSLPVDVQINGLRKIKGFENLRIITPGYAIEYDFFNPTQLKHSLETKLIENLFFAGQINGTTGYEEAAAQGLIAGINATQKIRKREEFILSRDKAYIGVLIDDLVTKGVDEPYRMFTSRSEFRILLRQDNADSRLMEYGYKLELVSQNRYNEFLTKKNKIDNIVKFIKSESITPKEVNELLIKKNTTEIKQKQKIQALLKRPQISVHDLISQISRIKSKIEELNANKKNLLEEAEILIKYEGYIEREKNIAEKISNLEGIFIRNDFDYDAIDSISTEAKQKLTRIRPKTIGHARRISGVSPSDINILLVHLGR